MNEDIHRITKVYKGMRERCNNPNHVGYKYYGEKGIMVLITKLEFIAWYLERIDGRTCKLNVDRINPSGHYEESNMQLLSATDNSKKTIKESPNWEVKFKNMKSANNNRKIPVTINGHLFDCVNEANDFGYNKKAVLRLIRAGCRYIATEKKNIRIKYFCEPINAQS